LGEKEQDFRRLHGAIGICVQHAPNTREFLEHPTDVFCLLPAQSSIRPAELLLVDEVVLVQIGLLHPEGRRKKKSG
jgi:hypothetical protein